MERVAFARTACAVLWGLAFACAGMGQARVARASLGAACVGDCDGCGTVTVPELITGVNMALGRLAISACPVFDRNGMDDVTVDELLAAVRAGLDGCPPPPTLTATPTDADTPTATPQLPTPTHTAEPTVTPQAPTPSVTPSATSATPTATPVGNPSGLTAAVDGGLVRLSWTPPDPASGYTSVVVLRRQNAAVGGPDDAQATQILFGAASSATDQVSALLPDLPGTPQTYSYAVYGCSAPASCERTGSATTLEPTLVQVLRAGGYTIHWRHTDADVCADNLTLGGADNPTVPDWWKSCDAQCATATARQLNDAGRMHAIAIGQAFDALAIPVGRVLSSEYCRCFTTAELMDFGPPIEQLQGISFFVYDEPNRCAHSYELIDQAPDSGTNTAIIGHAGFSATCDVVGALAWSEAAVFKPDGQGGSTFITRLTWDQWVMLP